MFIAIRPLSGCSKEVSTFKLVKKKKKEVEGGDVFVRHFE